MNKLSSEIKHEKFDEGSYKQKIIEPIKSKNIDQLVFVLQDLNMDLTGFEQAHFGSGARIKMLKEEKKSQNYSKKTGKYGKASVKVCLGDGGLSRIVIWIKEDGNIITDLTDNSTDEVKKAWEELQ
jgi:hypothetical protein